MLNKVLLSLGTNIDKEANLAQCHLLLNNIFTDIRYSKTSVTAPYGKTYKDDFLNQLAIVYTDKDKEEIQSLLKALEQEMGRNSSDKGKGIVKIDVDLIIWNKEVLRPTEISRSYIADLLPSLQD